MENEKVVVNQLVERFDAEELKSLGTADTAAALKAAASEMGKTLTDDEANALFAALSAASETGELSDEALETVAGGYFLSIDSTKKGSSGIKLL